MTLAAGLNVLLLDASLFTEPYDAALSEGLVDAGVRPIWVTRPTRREDRAKLPPEHTEPFFYRRTDEAGWLPAGLRPFVKGLAHLAGMARLVMRVRRSQPDVVHVQWVVLPLVDFAAITIIRRWCPVVLTVHDSAPWSAASWLQRLGYERPAKLAHRVIVHTRSAQQALQAAGVPEERLRVIPHGPLRLAVTASASATHSRDPRWTLLLFGEIKPYKGLDVLIEAVAAMAPSMRRRLRVVVAGRPRMDVTPLVARISELGLGEQFDLRLRRLTEEQMAQVFAEADGFVFPYRRIDASGVYFLVKPLGKWLIASRVGIFAEDMPGEGEGELVGPGDSLALARAIERAVVERPSGKACDPDCSWDDIGRATRAVYEEARQDFRSQTCAYR